MNSRSIGWRHLGGGAALLLVCLTISFASHGCSSAALRSWGTDEVVLYGAGNANVGGHRDFSVLFLVKNVVGLENGKYEVRQPPLWETAPRRRGRDGIDEVELRSPPIIERARHDGEWGWWDIKVVDVPLGKAQNPVSSFFKRTTGDGSVPGEFRRIGVSVIRGSSRDYRLMLWGEDPATDHWLRIGVVPVGRGSQSAARAFVKFVVLPFAFAIDVGLVPLAFAVLLLAVFLAVGRSVPVTLTAVGALFLACYPFVLISHAREQADIARALSPLASMPLDALQTPGGREFELTIPTDRQWQRIVHRMGPPSFLVVPANTADIDNRRTYAARELGVSVSVTRSGSAVTLTPTSDTPYAYSADTKNNGFKFAAEAGDRVVISAQMEASTVPPKTALIVVPNWGGLNMWDWMDGAAISHGIEELLSLVAVALGLLLIGSAVLVTRRGSLRPRRAG